MMIFTFVRIKEKKEPVCVFSYDGQDDDEIFNLVDEICSPYECEYKLIDVEFLGFGWPESLKKEDDCWILDNTQYLSDISLDINEIFNSVEGWDNVTRTEH